MQLTRNWRWLWSIAILLCLGSSAGAVNVTIDYSFDSSNFFGAGNPQGATAGLQAKSSLEAAASFYSNLLTDSFSVVQTPAPFHSSTFDGTVTWNWDAIFENPATGAQASLANPTIPANQYRIYVGARSLAGSEAGHGGPGGFDFDSNPSGGFTQPEIDQIDQIEPNSKTKYSIATSPLVSPLGAARSPSVPTQPGTTI